MGLIACCLLKAKKEADQPLISARTWVKGVTLKLCRVPLERSKEKAETE